MPLKKYEGKRDFIKTKEPRPEEAPSKKGGQFFVQRHDGSHPHYDFRLANDGVLKSWAVQGALNGPGGEALGDGSDRSPIGLRHLRGNDSQRRKFDLMRMRGEATGKEWLLVKGADGHGKEGWNVDDYEFSVGRQRTQREIASGSAGRPVPEAVAMKPMLAQKLPE